MNTMYDCIIIGGGMAGLTCAAHLTDSGLHVKVLEKNDRLGGRIRSFYDEYVTIETGASFLAGFYETAHKLVKDCGMDASSQKDSQETWPNLAVERAQSLAVVISRWQVTRTTRSRFYAL